MQYSEYCRIAEAGLERTVKNLRSGRQDNEIKSTRTVERRQKGFADVLCLKERFADLIKR
jgi:hypothetical protein